MIIAATIQYLGTIKGPSLPIEAAQTSEALNTSIAMTTQSHLDNAISTSTPTFASATIPSSTPLEISTIIPKDAATMVFVPAGEFMMGSNSYEDEKPIHKIYLDAFWIDKTEVKNGMYDKCVQAGMCNAPASIGSAKREYYYGNPEFYDYPVIFILWNDAYAYCAWVNRRLPTEAEWEKAARGIDGRPYTWGIASPSNSLLNYNSVIGDTTEVGKYPDGLSPYGALDMAGNVWEWVADWYDPSYYSVSPFSNPLGPNLGEYHVLRGGSWFSLEYNIRSTVREHSEPGFRQDLIGFRCANSP